MTSAWDLLLDWIYFRNPHAVKVLYSLMALATIGSLLVFTSLVRFAGDGALGRYARRIAPAWPYVLVFAGTSVAAGLQIAVERDLSNWLLAHGVDFTPYVFAVEGSLVEHLQNGLHDGPAGPLLDHVLVFAYTWGAYLISFVPLLFFVFTARVAAARHLTLMLVYTWIVGYTFYLFFPVFEVWAVAKEPGYGLDVQYLLGADAPSLKDAMLTRIHLNNNFPSLHVASTLVNAIAIHHARIVWMNAIAVPLAVLISFSTMYLGIHWALDVVAGVGLAWGAHRLYRWRESRTAFASHGRIDAPPTPLVGTAQVEATQPVADSETDTESTPFGNPLNKGRP